MSPLPKRGILLALCSPSGAGKSTLARALLRSDTNIRPSISMTTRPPRPSEVNGKDYHFVDRAGFQRALDAGLLLEWAEVHGNLYGTPLEPVRELIETGRDVVFDIDWQGAAVIQRAYPDDYVGVFVLPPSAEHLRSRLQTRAEDAPDVIAQRLKNARDEISHWREFQHVIVNDDVDRCFARLTAVVYVERVKRLHTLVVEQFAPKLLDDIDRLVEEIAIGLELEAGTNPGP
ncbi:guanylate kinase [Bosea sp. RAC05]|uniref:guanylate kinase n=1 Tax=Bosea sp. RAC05 TaxID=1842539 RepID=UPI00083CE8A2|nr:guanylate kinase [Bosea sp. RAC05]AOG03270.1 guanylate kinase [Bosea sp. RAC05]